MARPKPVRYAVVGLGYFAQSAVLPAFDRLKSSKLVAIVSGDPVKLKRVGDLHGVEWRVDYTQLDELFASGEVDAAYIVTPNTLHAGHVVQAARAGIHVLCEKPLAASEAECLPALEVVRQHGVKLMVAYRLHFEPSNLAAIRAIRAGKIGEPRCFQALFTMQVREGNSRLQANLGGGPLRDIGIYCINASRYLLGDRPLEVSAIAGSKPGDARFEDVPEQVAVTLRFSRGRVATFIAGFGAADVARCEVVGTQGFVRLDPAFHYSRALKLEIGGQHKHKRTYRKRDQVAAEIEYFSKCVREDQPPEPSALEGLFDVRIMDAIDESILRGRRVQIQPMPTPPPPDPDKRSYIPPHSEPRLFEAEPPSE